MPYKVIVEFISYEGDTTPWFGELSCKDLDSFIHDVEYIEIKPYLRPLSSMSEEQNKELYDKLIELELQALNGEINRIDAVKFEIDYYLENHIDYCGLIEKGLALEAPKEMYN